MKRINIDHNTTILQTLYHQPMTGIIVHPNPALIAHQLGNYQNDFRMNRMNYSFEFVEVMGKSYETVDPITGDVRYFTSKGYKVYDKSNGNLLFVIKEL